MTLSNFVLPYDINTEYKCADVCFIVLVRNLIWDHFNVLYEQKNEGIFMLQPSCGGYHVYS